MSGRVASKSGLSADTTRGSGDVPPEADYLFGRVRRAEGTDRGDGYVYYGGQAFTPGEDHPRAETRRPGLSGEKTSGAGPRPGGEGTWEGVEPGFGKHVCRAPHLSIVYD